MSELDDELRRRREVVRAADDALEEDARVEQRQEVERDAAWERLRLLVSGCADRLDRARVPTLPIVLRTPTPSSGPAFETTDERGWPFHDSRLRALTVATISDGTLIAPVWCGPLPAYPQPGIILDAAGRRPAPPPLRRAGDGLVYRAERGEICIASEDIFDRPQFVSARELVLDGTARLLERGLPQYR